MADTIGWIGSVFLAVCGAPQAWKCYRAGSARAISPLFVLLWLGGEVCYVVSVLLKFGWVDWMMLNYGLNILFASVIAYYMVFPKESSTPGS
jgi:uncharacterized protein with PQ loop repeat